MSITNFIRDDLTTGVLTATSVNLIGGIVIVGPNTFYGELAGDSITTGTRNVYIGQYAGQNATSGSASSK